MFSAYSDRSEPGDTTGAPPWPYRLHRLAALHPEETSR
jgi:hypothetical protein